MEFHLLLDNPRKRWWLLLYMAGWAGLGSGVGVAFENWDDALTRVSPALNAGFKVLALLLFFGALYLFERLQVAIREPVRLTVWPDRLGLFYQ